MPRPGCRRTMTDMPSGTWTHDDGRRAVTLLTRVTGPMMAAGATALLQALGDAAAMALVCPARCDASYSTPRRPPSTRRSDVPSF